MSTILTAWASTPPQNQAESLWDWTFLYWLPLPLIFGWACIKAWNVRQQQGPLKKVNEARGAQYQLHTEQETLKRWRDFVARTGQSPVGGKSAAQAIADQEALVRQLYQLQSELQSGLPEGGRGKFQPPSNEGSL